MRVGGHVANNGTDILYVIDGDRLGTWIVMMDATGEGGGSNAIMMRGGRHLEQRNEVDKFRVVRVAIPRLRRGEMSRVT